MCMLINKLHLIKNMFYAWYINLIFCTMLSGNMKFSSVCLCLTLVGLTEALPGYLECRLKQNLHGIQPKVPNRYRKASNKTADTLVLTSVVFRHGNRVPDVAYTGYPNNPYKNVSFFPYNEGDLTRDGQKTMYNRGRELRKRYKNFLGDMYFNDLVESVASSFIRCQMSLQALLTGLFGGLDDDPIKKISWQAVPYSIIPADKDNLLSFFLTCPSMMSNVHYPSTDNVDPETKTVFQTLEKYSGFETVGYREASLIYDFIKTSSEQGLEVPIDFKNIYPDPLRKVAMQDWNISSSQTVGLIGPLVKLITYHAVSKTSDTLEPQDRKMYLYACHDLNIIYLLQALNAWDGKEILYGTYVIFELHNIEGTYGFKVFLRNEYPEPRLLNITGCDTLCPVSMFVELADNLISQDLICN